MSEAYKHDLFLCHNHMDKAWTQNLAKRVEGESYKGRRLKVFIDEWDIKPGTNVVLELQRGLAESRYVGVVMSEHSVKSDWVDLEWTTSVSMDPSGRDGRVIPLWLGNCEVPLILANRNMLYCKTDAECEQSVKKLLAVLKNTPLDRGGETSVLMQTGMPELGTPQKEQLASNLLPVVKLPHHVWSGPIGKHASDIRKSYRENKSQQFLVCATRNEQMYCFNNPNSKHFFLEKYLIASTIDKKPINAYLVNEKMSRIVVELSNKAFATHCKTLGLEHDEKHKRFFFPSLDGNDITKKWDTGKKTSTRTVTARHLTPNTERAFWAHQSLRAQFMVIGGHMYLKLAPSWAFSYDGQNPVMDDWIKSMQQKWRRRERNLSILTHIRFWAYFLKNSGPDISFRAGDYNLTLDPTPIAAELDVGIEGDYHPLDAPIDEGLEELDAADDDRHSGVGGVTDAS